MKYGIISETIKELTHKACLVTLILLCLNSCGESLQEAPLTATVRITVNKKNVYDSSWDGLGSIRVGKSVASLGLDYSSPPDIAMCVFDEVKYKCSQSNSFNSECHDTYMCEWEIEIKKVPIGLFFYDLDNLIDESHSDFIDVIVFGEDIDKSIYTTYSRILKEKTRLYKLSVPEVLRQNVDFLPEVVELERNEEMRRRKRIKVISIHEISTKGVCLENSCIELDLSR